MINLSGAVPAINRLGNTMNFLQMIGFAMSVTIAIISEVLNRYTMIIEQLLLPRIKVIADYPHAPYLVDTILTVEADGELYSEQFGFTWSVKKVMYADIHNYPHLFKPLQWWEDRKAEDMPEYIKTSFGVCRVLKHFIEKDKVEFITSKLHERVLYYNTVNPATVEEYNNYLKTL